MFAFWISPSRQGFFTRDKDYESFGSFREILLSHKTYSGIRRGSSGSLNVGLVGLLYIRQHLFSCQNSDILFGRYFEPHPYLFYFQVIESIAILVGYAGWVVSSGVSQLSGKFFLTHQWAHSQESVGAKMRSGGCDDHRSCSHCLTLWCCCSCANENWNIPVRIGVYYARRNVMAVPVVVLGKAKLASACIVIVAGRTVALVIKEPLSGQREDSQCELGFP